MELLLDGFKNDVHDKCEATRSGFTTAKGLGAKVEVQGGIDGVYFETEVDQGS